MAPTTATHTLVEGGAGRQRSAADEHPKASEQRAGLDTYSPKTETTTKTMLRINPPLCFVFPLFGVLKRKLNRRK